MSADPRPDSNPKSAFGQRKPSISLVPPVAIILEAAVFGLGASKYGPYNWREASVSARVYLDAAERHIMSWQDGEGDDPESGMSHLAHARACLGIILDAQANGKLIDDRPIPGAAAATITRLTKPPEAGGWTPTPAPVAVGPRYSSAEIASLAERGTSSANLARDMKEAA